MTKKECEEKLKEFKGAIEIMLFLPSSKTLYFITQGDGDNLLPEDRAEGYNDYLYCKKQLYDGYGEFENEDGIMYYFNNDKDNFDEDVTEAVFYCLQNEFDTDGDNCIEFTPLFAEFKERSNA